MSNGSKINLLQMQNYFEEQINNIKVINDLELSENDYRSLGTKLKSLSFFSGSENDMEEIMLSIVVYSTYHLIYGDVSEGFDSIARILFNNSPYMERKRYQMYKDVFYDYGINTFDITSGDLKEICKKLTAIHAGVPNKEKTEYFNLLSNYLDCKDVDLLCDEIYDNLPQRTKIILGLMGTEIRKRFILKSRSLVSDVMDGMLSYDEVIDRYGKLSVSLVDHCFMWNDNSKHCIRFNIN